MFLLPCSRWVPGATPLGESRLRRRRSSRRHGTRVSPRHSSERRRQDVRTIEACSCSCCSAPSDRDKSGDHSPALCIHAVPLRDALSTAHRTSAGAPPSWLKGEGSSRWPILHRGHRRQPGRLRRLLDGVLAGVGLGPPGQASQRPHVLRRGQAGRTSRSALRLRPLRAATSPMNSPLPAMGRA